MYKRLLKNLETIVPIKLSAKHISWHLTWKAELICNNLQPCGEKERNPTADYEIFKNSNLFKNALCQATQMQQMTSTIFTCASYW